MRFETPACLSVCGKGKVRARWLHPCLLSRRAPADGEGWVGCPMGAALRSLMVVDAADADDDNACYVVFCLFCRGDGLVG